MIDPEEITHIEIKFSDGKERPLFTMKWCFIPSTGDTIDISGETFRVRDVLWEHDNGMCRVTIYLIPGQYPAD